MPEFDVEIPSATIERYAKMIREDWAALGYAPGESWLLIWKEERVRFRDKWQEIHRDTPIEEFFGFIIDRIEYFMNFLGNEAFLRNWGPEKEEAWQRYWKKLKLIIWNEVRRQNRELKEQESETEIKEKEKIKKPPIPPEEEEEEEMVPPLPTIPELPSIMGDRDARGRKIRRAEDPDEAEDLATKSYIDDKFSAGFSGDFATGDAKTGTVVTGLITDVS